MRSAQAIEPDAAAVTVTGDAYAPAAWARTLVELIAQRVAHGRRRRQAQTAATR